MDSLTAPIQAPKIYRVGTLAYTKSALLQVMFWMLWGEFFFQMMESIPGALIPLQLRWEGASDSLIGLLATPTALLAFCLYPVIGIQSDHHRGRLGRRRPFLLWCTPPAVFSLVLLGAAKPSGALLHRVALACHLGAHVTAAGCTIAWIALCSTAFVVFNAYITQVYTYLFADVIPQEVMGKFIGLFRVVGALGSIAFNRFVFGHAQEHTLKVYASIGLLYAAAFFLIVWRVKEGEYPPAPPKPPGHRWLTVKRYFRECFTHPFYLTFYCISFFIWGSLVPLNFMVFFATQAGRSGYAPTLGLSLAEFGHVKSWTFFIQIPVFFLVGPLCDRFHPIRVGLVGLFLSSASYFSCFWLVHGSTSLLLCWSINQGALAIFLGAGATLNPRVLPREQYGQYLSANQTFGYSSLIIGPLICGLLLGVVRDYRYVFIFCGICTTLTFAALAALYIQWKRLGGDHGFTPPVVLPKLAPPKAA